ncbi:hypothetical protein ACN31Y_005153, partial [Escherichia coli]
MLNISRSGFRHHYKTCFSQLAYHEVSLAMYRSVCSLLCSRFTPSLRKSDYTSDYTDRYTKGYNVKQAGTRKNTNLLIIKNIMHNLKH